MTEPIQRPVLTFADMASLSKKARSKLKRDHGYDNDPPCCKNCVHRGILLVKSNDHVVDQHEVAVCTVMRIRIEFNALCDDWKHVATGDILA
jgi:hypothetical protein